MPDWDSTGRSESDEDATWRDLIARFDSPVSAEEPVPWPDREDTPDRDVPDRDASDRDAAGAGTPPGDSPPPPIHVVIAAVPARAVPPAAKPADPPELADEHYVPPPPPPFPKLDPLTKGAWAALFSGPGYLLVATAAGWTIPGIAVFAAVAAFVAGVALLVFKLTDSDRDDSDDDGAVV